MIVFSRADGVKVINDDSNLASIVTLLFSTGYVLWVYPVSFNAQCSVNIQYYPFDYQTCTLMVSKFTHCFINDKNLPKLEAEREYLLCPFVEVNPFAGRLRFD